MTSYLFQKAANLYRRNFCNGRARDLYPNEKHVLCHNFCGPGTKIEKQSVRDYPPYDEIDNVCRNHDLAYMNARGDPHKIRQADKDMLQELEKYRGNEPYYTLAKLAISGKMKFEDIAPYLAKKISPEHFGEGLIGEFTDAELMTQRNPKYYTDTEKYIIDLLSINHESVVQPIGSFTQSIQKYPSDIDINQVITIKDINSFIREFKRVIRHLIKAKGVYFSDFKAGVDARFDPEKQREKYILRWSPKEILKGYKVLDGDVKMPLKKAITMLSPVKLDIIAFSDNRIIEASTFYIFKIKNKFVNVPQNFYEIFIDELKKDIKKYSSKDYKLFKAVKRMWSLARLQKDMKMLHKLAPMINSNLSLLGQINADLETLELFIEKATHKLPKKQLIEVINGLEKRLSTIADIKIPINFLGDNLEKLKHIIKKGIDPTKLIVLLHDEILKIINRETLAYMKYAKIWPIPKKYLK